MKPDLATRLAAVTADGVSISEAHSIIQEFLAQIIRCPACDDTGSIVVGHNVSIPTVDHLGQSVTDPLIKAGTVGRCPTCGGTDRKGRTRHDPEYVAWHCFARAAEQECRAAKDDPTRIDEQHAACGYRIVLPLRMPRLTAQE